MPMSKARAAQLMETDLREQVIPHWRQAVDEEHGGYRQTEVYPSRSEWIASHLRSVKRRAGAFLRRRPAPPRGKDLVTQSRLLWTLSTAHRLGYGDGCLEAAAHGYRFLTGRLLDQRHGGYAWIAARSGRIVDRRKTLYGQAFALFALTEYHRATGLAGPLGDARDVFEVVQARMHDDTNGGWIEHGDADFAPLAEGTPLPALPTVGLKTGNAHLHWMEALAELAQVTGDAAVHSALREALTINATYFYPERPEAGAELRTPDWRPVASGNSVPISYGHSMEFGWLMLRADEVLGSARSWDHFDALLADAVRWGFDHEQGGFYDRGPVAGAATRRSKIWWVQAEGLAALTDGVRHFDGRGYDRPLDLLLEWIWGRQRRPDGLWIPIVDENGKARSSIAPAAWKGGYHEVRAMARFIEAFHSAS